jgi:hypothetical protein
LLQESLASFVVNERSAFRITPSVQLDRKMAVIDGELKRWRIPHFFSDRMDIPFSSRIVKLSVGNALLKVSGRRLRRPTDLNALAPDFFGTRGGTEKKGCQESTGNPRTSERNVLEESVDLLQAILGLPAGVPGRTTQGLKL